MAESERALDILLLRLDAPLMSFGATKVDQHNVTGEMPLRSMLTGLLANALGHDHRDSEATQALQRRLQVASRQDRAGRFLIDFQTVALGQEIGGRKILEAGWTTRDVVEGRAGGSSDGTHIRNRHYLADALYTVALTLSDASERPTLDALEAALKEPARPLFLGRKACLPSSPLLLGRTRAPSLLDALRAAPFDDKRKPEQAHVKAWWPVDEQTQDELMRNDARKVAVFEERDWCNQLHTGRSFVWEGRIEVKETSDG